MTIRSDPIEAAVAEGARRALTKRAERLRQEAAELSTTAKDKDGHAVPIVPPEARVKARTADFLEECAAAIPSPHA
jgi:hypothetical protein